MKAKIWVLTFAVAVCACLAVVSGCSTMSKKEAEPKTFIEATDDGLVVHFRIKDKNVMGGSGLIVKEGQEIAVESRLTKGRVHVTASPDGDDIDAPSIDKEVTVSVDQICTEEGGTTEYHNVVPGSYMFIFSAEKPSKGDIVVTVRDDIEESDEDTEE